VVHGVMVWVSWFIGWWCGRSSRFMGWGRRGSRDAAAGHSPPFVEVGARVALSSWVILAVRMSCCWRFVGGASPLLPR
jgi:hypothetical protein